MALEKKLIKYPTSSDNSYFRNKNKEVTSCVENFGFGKFIPITGRLVSLQIMHKLNFSSPKGQSH